MLECKTNRGSTVTVITFFENVRRVHIFKNVQQNILFFSKLDKRGPGKLRSSVYKLNHLKKRLKYLNRFDELFSIKHVDLVIDKYKLFGDSISHPLFQKCDYMEIVGNTSYISNNEMNFVLNNFKLKNGLLTNCLIAEDFDVTAVSL